MVLYATDSEKYNNTETFQQLKKKFDIKNTVKI